MKKSIIALLAVMICLGLAIKPGLSKPKQKKQQKPKQTVAATKPFMSKKVEVKLGITMAYDWWKPAFISLENGMTGNVTAKNLRTACDGSFMMGPVLWIKIGSAWNLGATALFGLSKDRFKYTTLAADYSFLYLTIPQIPPVSIYIENGTSRARRYEADLAVEYSFHKYFNLLFGARFKYNDGEGDATRLSTLYFPISITNIEYNAWYVGPRVGVGFYYMYKGFSINAGVSALIQGGTYYCRKSFFNSQYGISVFAFIPDEFAVAYLAMGADASLKFAYFVERIRVEFWIGGRYTILPHISLYDAGSAYNARYKNGWITGELEQYGGINFGAAYKF